MELGLALLLLFTQNCAALALQRRFLAVRMKRRLVAWRRDAMAARLQSRHRGIVCRAHVRELRQAATVIQRRMHTLRERSQLVRARRASVVVQAAFRGHTTRRVHLRRVDAAILARNE